MISTEESPALLVVFRRRCLLLLLAVPAPGTVLILMLLLYREGLRVSPDALGEVLVGRKGGGGVVDNADAVSVGKEFF